MDPSCSNPLKEGLRVSTLKLKVHPSASFWMQPCRFIGGGYLKPLNTMLDQFVSDGVLISDSSCDFASPLVIVNKKDGGLRMAREFNMQLEVTTKQLPYQPTLFQRLGRQRFCSHDPTNIVNNKQRHHDCGRKL